MKRIPIHRETLYALTPAEGALAIGGDTGGVVPIGVPISAVSIVNTAILRPPPHPASLSWVR